MNTNTICFTAFRVCKSDNEYRNLDIKPSQQALAHTCKKNLIITVNYFEFNHT